MSFLTQCPDDDALIAYFDGGMNDEAFSSHVDACRDCRALVAALAHASSELPANPSAGEHDCFPYEIKEEIARGGIGQVLRAFDRRLGRDVALKILLEGSSSTASRFRNEAALTARLQHPSIVPVYEAGQLPSGESFFVMRMVPGRSLEDVVKATPQFDQRLALVPQVIAVCDAVAYAHGQRIIHRDIKPSNVLIGEFGETVVIDWGLGKDLATGEDPVAARNDNPSLGETDAPRLADRPSSGSGTIAGSVLGTPHFMPPEQARGEPVDERADVYALGATLYCVLRGVPPYDDHRLADVIGAVVAGPPRRVDAGHGGIPRDLVGIVDKAMRRDPSARYPSARELAEDLRRFAAGQFVAAHRYTRRERLARFAGRHAAPLAVGLIAALALSVTGVLSVVRILREHRRAEAGQRLAEQGKLVAESALEEADKQSRLASHRLDEVLLQQARSSLQANPDRTLELLAELSPTFQDVGAMRILAADAMSRPVAEWTFELGGQPNGPFINAGKLHSAATVDGRVWLLEAGGESRQIADQLPSEVAYLVGSRRGDVFIGLTREPALLMWRAPSWQLEKRVLPEGEHDMAVSSEGGWVALSHQSGLIELFDQDALTGTPRRRWHLDRFGGIQAIEDGRALLLNNGSIIRFDVKTGARTVLLPEGKLQVESLPAAFPFPGPLRIVFASSPSSLAIMSPESGSKHHLAFPVQRIVDVAMGKEDVAIQTRDGELWHWQPKQARLRKLVAAGSTITQIACSIDDRYVAAMSGDTVNVFDTQDGTHVQVGGHRGTVRKIDFDASGALWTTTEDGTIRTWRLRPSYRVLPGPTADVADCTPSLDGRNLTMTHGDGALWRWDLTTSLGGPLAKVRPAESLRVAAGHDGSFIVAGGNPALLSVVDPRGVVKEIGDVDDAGTWYGSPRGVWFAYLAKDSLSLVGIDLSGTRRRRIPFDQPFDPRSLGNVALSDQGDLAYAGAGGEVCVVSLPSDAAPTCYARHHGAVDIVRWLEHNHGPALLTAGRDRTAQIWDLAGKEIDRLDTVHTFRARASLDGRYVALAADLQFNIWTVGTRPPRVVPLASHGARPGIRFAPNGHRLVTFSDSGSAYLWDAESGEGRLLMQRPEAIAAGGFTPDSTAIFLCSVDGIARIVNDDLPDDAAALRKVIQRHVTRRKARDLDAK